MNDVAREALEQISRLRGKSNYTIDALAGVANSAAVKAFNHCADIADKALANPETSAPLGTAPHNSGERLPSSDAADSGAETNPETKAGADKSLAKGWLQPALDKAAERAAQMPTWMQDPNAPTPNVDDDALWALASTLHSNVPEADRPMSWSDYSPEQVQRLRDAAKAFLGKYRAALTPERERIAALEKALRGARDWVEAATTGALFASKSLSKDELILIDRALAQPAAKPDVEKIAKLISEHTYATSEMSDAESWDGGMKDWHKKIYLNLAKEILNTCGF